MNKIALSIEVDAVDSVRSCNMYKGQRCVALFRNLIVAWIAAPLPSQCCRILSKEHMVRSYAIVCVGRRRGQATVPFNSLHSFKIDFSGVVIFFCLVLSRFCCFFFSKCKNRKWWQTVGLVSNWKCGFGFSVYKYSYTFLSLGIQFLGKHSVRRLSFESPL